MLVTNHHMLICNIEDSIFLNLQSFLLDETACCGHRVLLVPLKEAT